MGLDCVNKMTESTEVFTISTASNMDFNQPRKDVESQNAEGSQRCRRYLVSYVIDISILVFILAIIALFEFGTIPSYKAGFYCKDPALSFPFQGETVTTPIIISTLFLLPFAVMLPTEVIVYEQQSKSKYLHCLKQTGWFFRTYLYGLLMNLGIVEVMKGIAGSPRPTFFDLCRPDTALTCTGNEFVTNFTCTSDYSWWYRLDSYRSFPSGHASLSVYCGFYIAWYLQKRAFDWNKKSTMAVPALQLLSITYSVVCSLTRITDHRHHWWDVLAGAVVGLFTLLYAVIFLANCFNVKKSEEPIELRLNDRQHSVRTLLYEDQKS